MGWHDYFVNQSDRDIQYTLDVADSFVQIKYNVKAHTNQLFARWGSGSQGWCLNAVTSSYGTYNIQDGNRCQNFEFLIGSNYQIQQSDGYIGPPPGPMEQKYPPTDAEYFSSAPAVSTDYARQRVLARTLASDAGAARTRELIESGNCFKEIFDAADEEGGTEKFVAALVQGPEEWAYQALVRLDLGDQVRNALLARKFDDPKWAFYAARDVREIGSSTRERLLRKVAEHPKWAHYALTDISDLGDVKEAIAHTAGEFKSAA
jgi:hypothetical protein